jgi:hypothetical protein
VQPLSLPESWPRKNPAGACTDDFVGYDVLVAVYELWSAAACRRFSKRGKLVDLYLAVLKSGGKPPRSKGGTVPRP